MNTLEKLYDDFYKPSNQKHLRAEIEKNQKKLMRKLSRKDKMRLFDIIDNESFIGDLHCSESFVCGLKLGLSISSELANYRQRDFDTSDEFLFDD